MADQIDVANLILTRLGANRITSINDTSSEEARKILAVWDLLRRAFLRLHSWGFASKEVQLAKLTSTPLLGDYSSIFQLPSDFIRLNSTDLPEGDAFRRKGNAIYCNSSSLIIEYVQDITDMAKWDDLAIIAFADFASWRLSYSITSSNTTTSELRSEFLKSYNLAKSVSSQEHTPPTIPSSSWVTSRY